MKRLIKSSRLEPHISQPPYLLPCEGTLKPPRTSSASRESIKKRFHWMIQTLVVIKATSYARTPRRIQAAWATDHMESMGRLLWEMTEPSSKCISDWSSLLRSTVSIVSITESQKLGGLLILTLFQWARMWPIKLHIIIEILRAFRIR